MVNQREILKLNSLKYTQLQMLPVYTAPETPSVKRSIWQMKTVWSDHLMIPSQMKKSWNYCIQKDRMQLIQEQNLITATFTKNWQSPV